MISGFEHLGLTASDLNATACFYRDILGLREVLRRPSGKGGQVAFFEAGSCMLEIVQPGEPVDTPARIVPRSEAGIRHIAFTVSDLDAEFERLSSLGVQFIEKPRTAFITEMFRKVAYCLDPDGIVVELTERADGR